MAEVILHPKLHVWGDNLIEANTKAQALMIAQLSIVPSYLALMADAHKGIGSTVGSVIPTHGAIIPAAIGVDIGCGMCAVLTTLRIDQLPDDHLTSLKPRIAQAIPAGVGQGHDEPTSAAAAWMLANPAPNGLSQRQAHAARTQFGSLGSGNHFFEVSADEEGRVWIVLHSGSRGVGNQLATMHIGQAKGIVGELLALNSEAERDAWFSSKPDAYAQYLQDLEKMRGRTPDGDSRDDMSYLLEGQPEFKAYIDDLMWAQRYARANRDAMMTAALEQFFEVVGYGEEVQRVNCHHNYTSVEQYDGRDVYISRKGAISAKAGEWGIIPGSMGTDTYIVRGLGNPASFMSSSHGAGRRLSRGAANRQVTDLDLEQAMAGKTWNNEGVHDLRDEAPSAYKSIQQVMEAQADLVEVVYRLTQVFNYKGYKEKRRRRGEEAPGPSHQ